MAERYNKKKQQIEENSKVDEFIEDILAVYEKHDLALAHEDSHGGFIVTENEERLQNWVGASSFDLKEAAPQKGDRVKITGDFDPDSNHTGKEGTYQGGGEYDWEIELDDGTVIQVDSLNVEFL